MAKKFRIKTNWGRTKKARDNMAWALWRIRARKREAVDAYPPISSDLLVWFDWAEGAAVQSDKWLKPDAENMFDMGVGSYEFEEFQVGTSDGADEILLPFDLPADAALTYNGTSIAALDIPNNKITMTAGTIRDIEITGTPLLVEL